MADIIKVLEVYKEWNIDESNSSYRLGEKYRDVIVNKIEHHLASGEGDQHYSTIYFEDGTTEIVYRPDSVLYDDK